MEDQSLAELHERASAPVPEDPREYSDFGELPDDYDIAAEIDAGVYVVQDDEHARRFHGMVQADEARRRPRRSWFDLKKSYSANPGVELPGITDERIERHKADQAAVQRRLRNSEGQPQDRFNNVTKAAVASRGTESRRLNRVFATADPRPVSQRQEFSFEGESFDGGPYRQGRPSGHRAGHADYAWDLGTTGFIY